MARVAKLTVETITLTCPGCGELIPEPHSGYKFWTKKELDWWRDRYFTLGFAPCCGVEFTLPRRKL